MKTLAALIAASLLLIACGGDDDSGGDAGSKGGDNKVSAAAYAADFCKALSAWTKSLQEGQQVIKTSSNATPAQGKKLLGDYFADAVTSTAAFVKGIDGAGIPDVEKGDKAAKALHDMGESARVKLEAARRQVGDLPTDSPQAFVRGATQLQTDLTKTFQGVTDDLEAAAKDIPTEDLDKAFENEPSCQG